MSINPMNHLHAYDALFYRYQREGAMRSAGVVLPLVQGILPVRSVLDVGCGAAAWLSIWSKLGVPDVIGVDGDYVERDLLLIDPSKFRSHDISSSFDLGRQFDLVMCLEVAEHVPPEASTVLVDNLVRHGSVVLFSAAVPGQGGENHINEQSYDYWRDLFAARKFRLFDVIRPCIASDKSVESWYRYNLLLFVHESAIDSLSREVRVARVPDDKSVPDPSPPLYRARKLLIRLLPTGVVTRLAIWKYRRFVRTLQSAQL